MIFPFLFFFFSLMSKANKKEARELGENCFSYSGPLGEEYFGGPLAHGPPGCGAAGRS